MLSLFLCLEVNMNQSKVKKYIGLIIGMALIFGGILLYETMNRNAYIELEPTKNISKSVTGKDAIKRAKPAGIVSGIYAKTKGVLVLDVTKLMGEKEVKSPAEGILQKGDYILACNGQELDSKEELEEMLDKSNGREQEFLIQRNNKEWEVKITPVFHEKHYKIGAWVRDDIAGLGTITLYTEDDEYVALGHCISDMDLGIEMNVSKGSIHSCKLTDIRKGKKNQPGALIGYINYDPEAPLANIEKNSACGICGEAFLIPKELEKEDYLPLGEKDDIHTGNAKLISNLSGKRCWYDVKIMKVNRIFSQKSKDFVVKITDERLLKKTGGIVQGMSGSPIVQDGKIIGALTHVFVNDPTKGYGIFIKEMLK